MFCPLSIWEGSVVEGPSPDPDWAPVAGGDCGGVGVA